MSPLGDRGLWARLVLKREGLSKMLHANAGEIGQGNKQASILSTRIESQLREIARQLCPTGDLSTSAVSKASYRLFLHCLGWRIISLA